MLPDYFAILDLDCGATDAQVRNAYFRLAEQCHPERGGSHDAMKRVAEAWEILSHPDRRLRYSRARVLPEDTPAQAAAATDIAEAVLAAENYPTSWSDFSALGYGMTSYFGLPFPTVAGSGFGAVFIGGGAVLGGALAIAIVALFNPPEQFWRSLWIRLLVLPAAVVSAWIGRWFHSRLENRPPIDRKSSKGKSENSAFPDVFEVVRCPECLSPLRLPASLREVSVSCPKCKYHFMFSGALLRQSRESARVLRILVTIYTTLSIADFALPWSSLVPSELQAWRIAQDNAQSFSMLERIPGALAIAFGLVFVLHCAHLAAVIGLYMLKRWGRWLFVASTGAFFVLSLFSGPQVGAAPELLVDGVQFALLGAILAVAYCTSAIDG